MDFHAFASDFQVSFSREANRYFFSPGRVNLIGEHTDYNGGHVFPCAITYGTYGAVSKRKDRLVRLFSKNFPEQGMIEFTLDELDYNRDHGWANYPKGMLQFLQKKVIILQKDLICSYQEIFQMEQVFPRRHLC